MPSISDFHENVKNNRDTLLKEYMWMNNSDFYKKYKVGAIVVNYYFWWIKKKLYNTDQSWREEVGEMLKRKSKEKERIPQRVEILFNIVSKLLKEYTETEIVNGEFIP
jgi:hypothetical protein